MDILFLIIPFALLIATIFVVSFIIAVKKGQFDDLDTPSHRMLIDDDKKILEEK
jgi:cbb3-type cytochrome oxidase maturation protein